MGFTRMLVPAANVEAGDLRATGDRAEGQAELLGVRSVGEALDLLLS